MAAYATASEYRARNEHSSTSEDGLITDILAAVSLVVDRRTGVAPGMFADLGVQTFTLRSVGGTHLYLRDSYGSQYFLRAPAEDPITITVGGSEIELPDDGVTLLPENAAAFAEPYTAVERTTSWPRGTVTVEASWGWAATPGAIKERVISIARELIETHAAGPTLTLQEIDTQVQLNPGARSLMAMVEQEYRYRLVGV